MSSSEITLIFRWILPLWALGWLVLPLSSRLFPFLPDNGLAVGRVLALVLVSLIAFWGAATHLAPLSVAPFLLILAPLLVGFGWKNAPRRTRIGREWRALLLSDLVFLLGFGAFLWIRLRHPETNDLEKPMDMALFSSAMRAQFLPFGNPWLSGIPFTNYYYFGPLMGALLARTLATPPYIAYNLVQPLFCAFFLSVSWNLSAALSKSWRMGFAVMFLVALGGHFEPLRQISQTHQWWPLDWWKTSRVIENTINEYPAFTLVVGDLHAHFYALCLAVAHFCVCFGVLKASNPRQRSALLLLGGLLLGVFALTNTWDVPLYGLLWAGSAFLARKRAQWTKQNTLAAVVAVFGIAVVALPYFLKFKSQVSGVAFDFWIPPLFSLSLLWGSWWMLGFLAVAMSSGEEKVSEEAIFRRILMVLGLVALLFPCFFYIRGYFGDGDLRHQDTVFKFGLQAWILGGLGIASEFGFRFRAWWKNAVMPFRFVAAVTAIAFLIVLFLAPACVIWARTVRDAPRDTQGNFILSLNAARYIPEEDLAAIEWLRQNAKNGDSLVEAIGDNGSGGPGGDYDGNVGRVAAFSGVPDALGWPQHVWMWGAAFDEINRRGTMINALYHPPYATDSVQKLGANYVFVGSQERIIDPSIAVNLQRQNPILIPVGPELSPEQTRILQLKQ